MTKKIGQIRKQFLRRERLMLITEHLIRNEKQRKWTPSQKKRWESFLSNYEGNIDRICNELRYQVWKPEPFIIFDKQEGQKKRRIYESYPESLIVDTLFYDCLMYVFFEKKHIIPNSCYGSIKGRGQHELRAKIIKLVRGRRDLYAYVGDTAKYYPTINQEVLMNAFRQHIKDQWLLWLCETCTSRLPGMQGIALGLPSSNPIGHIYHAILDWFVILQLKTRRYYRFCDDKWAFHKDVNYLHSIAREITTSTKEHLDQGIKKTWRVLNCAEERFECLGAMVNSHGGRLKTYSRRRIERNIKKRIRQGDPMQALRTWGGIKGSLVGLSVSNLIAYWEEVYPEFFELLDTAYKQIKEHKMRKQRHKKLEKILVKAKDMRSLSSSAIQEDQVC